MYSEAMCYRTDNETLQLFQFNCEKCYIYHWRFKPGAFSATVRPCAYLSLRPAHGLSDKKVTAPLEHLPSIVTHGLPR